MATRKKWSNLYFVFQKLLTWQKYLHLENHIPNFERNLLSQTNTIYHNLEQGHKYIIHLSIQVPHILGEDELVVPSIQVPHIVGEDELVVPTMTTKITELVKHRLQSSYSH